MIWIFEQLAAFAYSIAIFKPLRNSVSRPGTAASPKSPCWPPGGVLIKTKSTPQEATTEPNSWTENSYGQANSTNLNPYAFIIRLSRKINSNTTINLRFKNTFLPISPERTVLANLPLPWITSLYLQQISWFLGFSNLLSLDVTAQEKGTRVRLAGNRRKFNH